MLRVCAAMVILFKISVCMLSVVSIHLPLLNYISKVKRMGDINVKIIFEKIINMYLDIEKRNHIKYIISVYTRIKLMRIIRNTLGTALITAALLMPGCDREDQNSNGLSALLVLLLQPPPCPEITVPAGTTVVKSVSVRHEGEWYSTYMLRIEYAPAEASYAMWIPPKDGGIKPAVLMTNPYDGIRWNGDDPPSYMAVYPYQTYLHSPRIFF